MHQYAGSVLLAKVNSIQQWQLNRIYRKGTFIYGHLAGSCSLCRWRGGAAPARYGGPAHHFYLDPPVAWTLLEFFIYTVTLTTSHRYHHVDSKA